MPNLHRTRTLKRFNAVSTNRLTVTAFSLREARGLLPAAAVVVGWAPAREVQA